MSETTTTDTTTEPTTPKRSSRFSNQNFETKVGKSELLLSVLGDETPENLARYGITSEAVNTFETSITTLKATNQRQEDIKASLKTITAQLQNEQKQMEGYYSTFKRKLKAETPMQEWKRFGFADKK